MRHLELLAPAADVEIARQAILHGADAVYIGASSHGARKAASNAVSDIASLVKFAHPFRAKVYVTVNTIVYENELDKVRHLVEELYRAGADAIIVQDMGLLRMNLPPISLHASTQCDTRSVEKARFLEEAGFSQIVLARELTLGEIRQICGSVSVPVECFVHGALCVSYSGRCHASHACLNRSANRGECAQMCRLPYTLTDAGGRVLARDRYLLSLRDLNLSDRMADMVEAGVSSFKIEGRLKDVTYVKNITAFYRRILDDIISREPNKYCRSSAGHSELRFEPAPEKSFNRGFTHYFLDERRPHGIWSPLTPKSMGEPLSDISEAKPGDGISFFNRQGEYDGFLVNGPVERIRNGAQLRIGGRKLHPSTQFFRTSDPVWKSAMEKETARRFIYVDVGIDERGVSAVDERGVAVRVSLDVNKDVARKPLDPKPYFSKLGNTIYRLREFRNHLDPSTFIPASDLSKIRQRMVDALDSAACATFTYDYRRSENLSAIYPVDVLDYRDNVSNSLAEKFYRDHGVRIIGKALETSGSAGHQCVVMTTRHCILREIGMCLKEGNKVSLPLRITSGNNGFTLAFDCRRCEMQLLT